MDIDKVLTGGIFTIPIRPPFDTPIYYNPAAIAIVLGNCASLVGWSKKRSWFPFVQMGSDLSRFKEVISFAAPYQYFFLSMGKLTANTVKFLNSLINIPNEKISVIISDPKTSVLKNYGEKECHRAEKLLIAQGVDTKTASQVWKLCYPARYYGGGLIKPTEYLCPNAEWVPVYYAGISGIFSAGNHIVKKLSQHYEYDHIVYHLRAAAKTANKDRGNYLNHISGKVGTIGFEINGFDCIFSKPVPPIQFYPAIKKARWHYICYPKKQSEFVWGPTERFLDSLVMGGIALYNNDCEYLVKDPLLRKWCIVSSPNKLDEITKAIPDELKPEIYNKQLEMWDFYTKATSFEEAGIILNNN